MNSAESAALNREWSIMMAGFAKRIEEAGLPPYTRVCPYCGTTHKIDQCLQAKFIASQFESKLPKE